jgi:hypothetical protein
MSAAAVEVVTASVVSRHAELTAQLSSGVISMCAALWDIRREKTYRAQGCDSFGEFLRRAGISETTGRLYANAGPALLELQRSGHGDLIKHAELLKPIHLMIAKAVRENSDADAQRVAQTQANIVRLAAQVAKQGQEPLTARVIERVAEKNFRWLPGSKRNKKQDDSEQQEQKSWEHPFRANARAVIEHARVQLAGLSPENAVHVAAVHRLPGFMDLAQWFVDVCDLAAHRTDDLFLTDDQRGG